MWANKHLSDGHLPLAVVQSFRHHVADPIAVAAALVKARLWNKNGNNGYVIHDYAEFGNPNAAKVKAYRKRERERKQRGRERRKALLEKARSVRTVSHADTPRTKRAVQTDTARAIRARNVESN
jgi:hypothetical protein